MRSTSSTTRRRDGFHGPRLLALGLLLATVLFPLLAYDWVTDPATATFCPLRAVTGVPCPSCGITRALAHLERGHLAAAVRFHPFAPLVLPLALALIAMLAFELASGREVIANPLRNRRDVWLAFAGLVVFQVTRTVIFFLDGGWSVFWHENLIARLLSLARAVLH